MNYTKLIDLIFSFGFVEVNTLVCVLNLLQDKIKSLNSTKYKRIFHNEVLKLQEDMIFEDGFMALNLNKDVTNIDTIMIICIDIENESLGDTLLLSSSIEKVEGKKIFFKRSVDISKFDSFLVTYSY